MIQFDWSKLITIDSNPVTPDTNGYNLETGGFICNQTNQKNGYKRLRIDGTVTTLKNRLQNWLQIIVVILRM